MIYQHTKDRDRMRDTLEFNNYKYEDDKYIYTYEINIINNSLIFVDNYRYIYCLCNYNY